MTTPTPAYAFGDTVLVGTHRYVCVDPVNAASGASATPTRLPSQFQIWRSEYPTNSAAWSYDNDTWVLMPWNDAPTKISANTGTFGQLYAAYWAVMGEQTVS